MLCIRGHILGSVVALGVGLTIAARADAQLGPTCTPATLNSSAIKASSVTVSPLSGSRDASPQTQISFLGVPAAALGAVSVTGSRTGRHGGSLRAYSQGDGASFVPARPFAAGERVSVRARVNVAGVAQTIVENFAVASEDPLSSTPETIHAGTAAQVQAFRSRPDLQPPVVTVTAHAPAASGEDVFAAPYTGPGEAGPMILDASGGLLWFKALPRDTFATDLRVQEYLGRPVLTWWQGDISVHGFGRGEGVIADSAYEDIAHVRAGNGYEADLHELQLTPAGTALITAYAPIRCDLSAAGGPAEGAVTDGVLQEIDVRTGLVMYEWTSLDHVALSESYSHASASSTPSPFDFFHINSIDLDGDGSLLISARNTWAVYRLAAGSGQVLWRLGGKHSSFTQAPGTRTAWQHDPRLLPSGQISLFDNGASPTVHPQSRGIVVSVDPATGAENLVAQFVHSPPLVVDSQGNLQALAGGSWFVGWGQLPEVSEFSASGSTLFDAHFPAGTQSYRSFRFAWQGTPAHPPAFALSGSSARGATVYASWNGATQVAGWQLLGGARPSALGVLAQAARSGFETALALPAGTHAAYVAVRALDASGAILATSPVRAEASLR